MPKKDPFVGAGCPFTGFGPCQMERCGFYVTTDLRARERACAIQETHFQILVNNLSIQSALLGTASADAALVETWTQRLTESLLSALGNLAGLAAHPATAPGLKRKLQDLQRELRRALETFVDHEDTCS